MLNPARVLTLTALGATAAVAQQYTVATFAGGVPPITPVPALQVSVSPSGVSVDGSGNVYLASLNCLFKVDPDGVITLVAGNARTGFSGDGGPADKSQFNQPDGIATDAAGNIYVADTYNFRIRRISVSGMVNTIAGGGLDPDDGGPATGALLRGPSAVVVGSDGNVYLTDPGSETIRKISPEGLITTVAGNGSQGYSGDGGLATNAELAGPIALALDKSGSLYFADSTNNRIRKVSPDGVITTFAGNGSPGYSGDGGPAANAELWAPWGVAVDATGNVYISDIGNYRVRMVNPGGIITTIAGNGSFDDSGDGGPALDAALSAPGFLAVDKNGGLYISDAERIRKISPTGIISTIAGDGFSSYSGDYGPVTSAQFYRTDGVAIDSSGSIYISDTFNNRIRKVSADGIVLTVAGDGQAGYSGDSGPATSAELSGPTGIILDAEGNLYIADEANNRIRMLTPGGIITTVAGDGSAGFSGDGGPAAEAELFAPQSVALDSAGNLYIADYGNSCIRRVAPSGIITTVAGNGLLGYAGDGGPATEAQFNQPIGVAVDSQDRLYIADSYNNRIRMVSQQGIISTVVGNGLPESTGDGGPASSAQVAGPTALTFDSAGNYYIADSDGGRIRKVSASGTITTIAGDGLAGYSGDGGPATSAEFYSPYTIAVDPRGNLYVADSYNNAVRLLSPTNAACTYATSALALEASPAGDRLLLALNTGAGCGWQIIGLPEWITLGGPVNGTGPATIALNVAANTGLTRSASMSLAGFSVRVEQGNSQPIRTHPHCPPGHYCPALSTQNQAEHL